MLQWVRICSQCAFGLARTIAVCALQHTATRYNALQHATTHCNTLQHTATHYNTLQHTPTHCNTLQHTATRYNTLQHTATHCNTLEITYHRGMKVPLDRYRIAMLQHTATRCNTLLHTATHFNTRTCAFRLAHNTVHVRVLECVGVCWSVLECVGVCCRESSVLQCAAVCCSVLQHRCPITAGKDPLP